MYDKAFVLELLEQLRTASQTIRERFKPVETVSEEKDLIEDTLGMIV